VITSPNLSTMLSLTRVLSTVTSIPRNPTPARFRLSSQVAILYSPTLDKIECLNKYFASVFTTENNLIPPLNADHSSMDNILVTSPGVFKLLSNPDMKKSSGLDDIYPCILKECASELTSVLTYLFNESLFTGTVPADWRDANVFALLKKGPRDVPENYSPISLTSVISKILEHIVYSSISNFLEKNAILTPRQHGFRPNRSCTTQLTLAIDNWAKSLDQGYRIDTAIFDFSKAFDSVPHTKNSLPKSRPMAYEVPLYIGLILLLAVAGNELRYPASSHPGFQ
jgi:Reverse transcriptase (RNA-dependent DNA polymerase)